MYRTRQSATVFALSWLLLNGCSSDEPKTAPQPELAEILAFKDNVGNDATKVNRFRSLLSQLDEKYVEDRKGIASLAIVTQEMLQEEGVTESMLNIMEGLNRAMIVKLQNQQFIEYANAYRMLRIQGMSHDEAVDGLAAFLTAVS